MFSIDLYSGNSEQSDKIVPKLLVYVKSARTHFSLLRLDGSHRRLARIAFVGDRVATGVCPMSSASGTITVASRNGFIHEFRNLLDSALRARKRGEAYGPVDLTNGAVKVTVAAPAMPAKPVGNHTPPATEQV